MIIIIIKFTFFPSLIKKIHEAKIKNKKIILWGNGKAKRELFMLMIS